LRQSVTHALGIQCYPWLRQDLNRFDDLDVTTSQPLDPSNDT